MKKFLIALVLLLGILFIIGRAAEMQDIGKVLQRGDFSWIALAFVLLGGWFFNLGLTYQAIYAILDMPVSALHMTRVATAVNFLNIVAPSAGLGSVAIFMSDAASNNRSTGKTAIAAVMFVLLEYVAVLFVLVFGLAELAYRNNLHWAEVIASLILLIGALGLAILLYIGMQSASLFARVLQWGARTVNRLLKPFIKKEYLSEERAHEFAFEAAEGIAIVRHHPQRIIRPILLALLNKVILIGILTLTFLAFHVPFTPGVVIAGFSLASLFLIVSPTPAGIGIVEGVLTVALRSLQVPIEDAAVITMAYRGITFWVPLLVGMVTFRTLPHHQ